MREIPIEKNDDIEFTIDALGSEGQGIGRVDGYTVFVPLALPGEKIRAHVIKTTSGYGVAKLTEVMEPSKDRAQQDCPAYPRCGGCSMRHMSYAAQLAARKRPHELVGVLPEPHGFENFRKPFRAARLRNPRYLQRASDRLRHGQHRVRAGKLRGESHPAHQFVGGFYLLPLEERLPLRRDYPKHRFYEGRLPASGRADNGVHRAPFE